MRLPFVVYLISPKLPGKANISQAYHEFEKYSFLRRKKSVSVNYAKCRKIHSSVNLLSVCFLSQKHWRKCGGWVVLEIKHWLLWMPIETLRRNCFSFSNLVILFVTFSGPVRGVPLSISARLARTRLRLERRWLNAQRPCYSWSFLAHHSHHKIHIITIR